MTPLLSVSGLVKRFGGLVATTDPSLDVDEGELHALIGPNGAGKTTLIAQLMGDVRQDAGTIALAGRSLDGLSTAKRVGLGLGRTFQVVELLPSYTALDNVALAVQVRAGTSFRFFADARADAALRGPAQRHLAQAGLGHRADVRVADLSQGERKQLELAVALAREPRLLLLDEPMAGLGAGESRTMVEMLAGLKRRVTMLLVEHDMDAVFSLADRVSVLVYGRILVTGTPAQIQADAAVREAYLGEGGA
jgi:branched-chain amino acid transport system ATP-binding protein